MANSTQTAVSDGNLELVTLSFNYLDRSEISVFFDSVPTSAWEWVGVSDPIIKFTPKVPNGVTVLIKRTTDQSELRHQYSLGAKFDAPTLDESLAQVLHIVQEASEANFSGDFYGPINMHVNRIINVAPAVDPTDVPNFAQLGTYRDDAAASAAAASSAVVAAGNASRLTVGTVTTGSPGSSAAVAITGSPGSQVVNFTIPRGDVGPSGALPTGGTYGQLLECRPTDNPPAGWITPDWLDNTTARSAYKRRITSSTTLTNTSSGWTDSLPGNYAPTAAQEVTVTLRDFTVGANSGIIRLRVGTAASILNTGYDGVSSTISGGSSGTNSHVSDVVLPVTGGNSGVGRICGRITFTRQGTSNAYVYAGMAYSYNATTSGYTITHVCGRIVLPDLFTRLAFISDGLMNGTYSLEVTT